MLKQLEDSDPGNRYGVPYLWGTTGFTYNVKMIRERMPDAPVDSGDMIFKPEIARRFADCGITFLDEPTDVIPMAMRYLGHDPDSIDPAHLARSRGGAEERAARTSAISALRRCSIDLPNEEVCIAMSWSGDYAQAMYRAKEAGRPVELAYTTPREGTLAWFDLWFIPADAPHPGNAHLFLNYLLRPDVIAAISNETRYAAANAKALPLVLPEVRNDPAVYPPDELRLTLREGILHSPKEERLRSRLWSRVKTRL